MDHDWPVLESVTEYETGWYAGGYDLVEQPDGSTKRYYWADLPPAVVVLAVADGATVETSRDTGGTGGDEIVFVEQYRPVVGDSFLECPAGIVEEGESFTQAGARELEEETGLRPETTALLETFWVSTGVLRHERAIVYADDLVPAERDLDSNEFLTVTTVPVDEALSRARADPANDATIEAILLAREEGLLD